MTTRARATTPARARTRSARRTAPAEDLDATLAAAEATTIVVWRGERIRFAAVPERIARIDGREARELLYGSWNEALEALNPLRERRAASRAPGAPGDAAATSSSLSGFADASETPYHAALRRYLAQIGIEQGDASEADLWHVLRGSAWSHWFDARETRRALDAAGRRGADPGYLDGWRAADHQLRAPWKAANPTVAAAIGDAYGWLLASPEFLTEVVGVTPADRVPLADFAALAKLCRTRRAQALLDYELRAAATVDPGVKRAYYSGVVGLALGVLVDGAGYLAAVDEPFASAAALDAHVLGGMLVDALESRHGARWWTDRGASSLVARVASMATVTDALAELGYDGLDWEPVLRQIRTRLIGEMSGYGGPNITTRAGTRKV